MGLSGPFRGSPIQLFHYLLTKGRLHLKDLKFSKDTVVSLVILGYSSLATLEDML